MTTTFKDLGLSDFRLDQLDKLGFTEPTEIQTRAIPFLLQGEDIVGQSQTGTGKTAAYSLPILDRIDWHKSSVQALILTPTRELAQQVAQAIQNFAGNRQLRVLTICGGQSMERQIQGLDRGSQIVVGTPGRIIDLLERGKLALDELRFVVLDEADEMLSMGFIDDVKRILQEAPDHRQTACFSATMPREIRDLVERFLRDPVSVTVTQPKAAPSRIDQQVYYVPRGWSKIKLLLPILEWAQPESAIIFVRTKMMATLLTAELKEAGQSVDEYHGSLSQHQRETLVRRFREGKIRLVVATDIAARGLDVESLSHVINYDLPDSSETYIHRIGRTGRAGKSGTAIALVQPMDQRLLRQIEQRLKQTMRVCQIPSQVEVQARRLASLEDQVKEALSGERMASFLPLVHQLGAEYDPLAIAAAALQMVYDKNCPQWLREGWDVPPPFVPKPKREGEREYKGGGGGYQGRRDRRDRPYRSEYKGDYKGGRSGSGSRRSSSPNSSRFS